MLPLLSHHFLLPPFDPHNVVEPFSSFRMLSNSCLLDRIPSFAVLVKFACFFLLMILAKVEVTCLVRLQPVKGKDAPCPGGR